MELVKKKIHMDRIASRAGTQIVLEEDVNISDNKPDAGSLLCSKGDVILEEIRAGENTVNMKGRLVVSILYLTDMEGSCASMETAILVSDCSRRGVQAVGRIAQLIRECEMKPSKVGLIINRAPKAELNPGILEEIQKQGLDLIGVVPQDESVYEYDCDGKPTVTLPEDNAMRKAAFEIFDKLNL